FSRAWSSDVCSSDLALNTIAINYEKEAKLREQIKSAMTYPVMVLCMSVVAVIVMLIFIVPIFQKMFEGMGSELPLPTMMLVWLRSEERRVGTTAYGR